MSGDSILGSFVAVDERGVFSEAAEASFDGLLFRLEDLGLGQSFFFQLNSLELK